MKKILTMNLIWMLLTGVIMNNKRSGKFYRKNEAEVMEKLGLKPTKNSGSGWIEKEDGQSDSLICQLKSTDKKSISLIQKDLNTLEYNAQVSHKLPVFAIQFLNTDDIFVVCRPSILKEIAQYLEDGTYKNNDNVFIVEETKSKDDDGEIIVKRKVIKSDPYARESFNNEIRNKYKKENKANE